MSEVTQSFKPESFVNANEANRDRIDLLINEIAEIAVNKTGGTKSTHRYQTKYLLSMYASSDHVSILEKILKDLKSSEQVESLLVLVSKKIREVAFQDIAI